MTADPGLSSFKEEKQAQQSQPSGHGESDSAWLFPTIITLGPITVNGKSNPREVICLTTSSPSPRSQTPVWERTSPKLLFRSWSGRNGVSRTDVPKQEFGNERTANRIRANSFALQRPALAVLVVQQLVGGAVVGELHARPVPFQLLAGLDGGVAQQDRLGEHAGVAEVA